MNPKVYERMNDRVRAEISRRLSSAVQKEADALVGELVAKGFDRREACNAVITGRVVLSVQK